MRKVYLVGTDHRYQRGFALGVEDGAFEEFRAMIRAVIARHGFRGIAQEMSPEGVHALQKTGSVGFSLCRELGLAHLYCDPDAATREALFIPKGEEGNPKRERYWLELLKCVKSFRTHLFGDATDTVTRYHGANHRAEFFKRSIFNAKSKPSLQRWSVPTR
jgi:hypothetical protein